MLKKYVIYSAVLILAANCSASFQDKITQIVLRKEQAKVKYGIIVAEPESKARVFGYSESIGLVPASNMKLVTTFTALKYLGPMYEFNTRAAMSGKNLVIIGSGDPLLEADNEDGSGNFLTDIIKALKERNITEIGDIVIDSSVFDNIRVNPSWPRAELNKSYACEVSGVNYNANCVRILASQKDKKVELQIEPSTGYLKLINTVKPVNNGNSALGAYRTAKENVLVIKGKCRKPASFDTAIERPAMFFGTLLAENLGREGIKISGSVVEADTDSGNLQPLAEHRTRIMDVVKQCNKDSFNLAAECLLKTLGAKQNNGKDGSWQGGGKAVADYLVSIGAEQGHFNIDDGSGLSVKNRLSAGIIARVLCDAYSSDLWPVFKETLAEGGVDGTLKKYFGQDKYKGKIFAKTGYINGVRALSGICTANSGREYIFSILTNNANYKTKQAIFDIVKAIIDEG